MNNIPEILNKYKNGYKLIIDTLFSIPKEVFDFKPAPEKWSIRRIIIHVVDSEANGFVRLKKAIAESGSPVTPYDQDKWADNLHYDEMNIDDHLELFRMQRNLLCSLLSKIEEKEWDNFMDHPERGRITVHDHIVELTEHVDTHIRQIMRNFDEWKNR